jgi:hypothetical protein
MLGAIQALEDDGLRAGSQSPQAETPERARTSGHLPGQAGSVTDTKGW